MPCTRPQTVQPNQLQANKIAACERANDASITFILFVSNVHTPFLVAPPNGEKTSKQTPPNNEGALQHRTQEHVAANAQHEEKTTNSLPTCEED